MITSGTSVAIALSLFPLSLGLRIEQSISVEVQPLPLGEVGLSGPGEGSGGTDRTRANYGQRPSPAAETATSPASGRGDRWSDIRHLLFGRSLACATIATCFVAIGDVDFVAQIISMFFMVAYGALCTIAFLKHFVADPAYRPVFHSRWYISLFGALMCLILMFSMSAPYAVISLALMALAYWAISSTNPDRQGVATIFIRLILKLTTGQRCGLS